ncbi:MAG: type II secretion system F family protein, partial [Lachnospiraceae bacterium]|nr:type II secretion system F family protein [Lachnospiraceae bacterium]
MATYGYKAITKAGKEVKGSLEADNKDLAMAELRRQELTVIDLGEQSFLTKDIDIQIGGWPKARDLSVMCRQFVSMTKAGVSILESLKMLCEQTENKRLQDALKEVRISVEKGETLADSMAEHPKVFPAIMVNMVAAGEASGSLETAMDRVATQLEKSHKTQAMVKKAMIYPIIVLVVALAVVIFMLIYIVPKFMEIFESVGINMPKITLMVVGASDWLMKNWLIALLIVIGLIIAIIAFAKSPTGKKFFSYI